MSYSFKSNGLPIKSGEKLTFPIAAEEPSILDLQWSCTDALDLEFTLSFMPAEGGEESIMVPSERRHMCQNKLDIEGPGNCMLQWNNCCGSWFGGSICTLTYTVTLQSKREIEDEQRRQLEAEEADLRHEAETIREQMQALEEERGRLRREERQEKIAKLRTEADESQVCLFETRRSLARQAAEIDRLKEALAAAEEGHSAEAARASVLEQELSTALEAVKKLVAEQKQDCTEAELQEVHCARADEKAEDAEEEVHCAEAEEKFDEAEEVENQTLELAESEGTASEEEV